MVVGIVSLSMEQPRKSNFLVPLMCSPTYHVGAPRTRPHEMWVCKKAKSIVVARVPLIGGLPPTLASFRIIGSPLPPT